MSTTRNKALFVSIGLVVAAALVVGVLAIQTAEAARPPRPLCGFTAIWICTLPNGHQTTKTGTQCDIAKYEKHTGATCVLAGS